MRPPFLKSADGTDRPRVEGSPDGAQHLVNVCHAPGAAPTRGEPGNPVMLVDDEIEGRLLSIPFPRRDDGCSHAPATHHANSVDRLLPRRTVKIVTEPTRLMPPTDQGRQLRDGDAFRAPGQGVSRIPPVQHQESHRRRLSPTRGGQLNFFRRNDVNHGEYRRTKAAKGKDSDKKCRTNLGAKGDAVDARSPF